jgi:hypothetical protein
MSVGQPENEFAHPPRLFDWWCGNVDAHCDGAAVRRVKLSTDIDTHVDRPWWRRCRRQPKAWADAPRAENQTHHRRRVAHRVELPGSEYRTQDVQLRGDVENWERRFHTEDGGGFRFALPTQHDRLVREYPVRIPLRQTAVLDEADPSGSGQ